MLYLRAFIKSNTNLVLFNEKMFFSVVWTLQHWYLFENAGLGSTMKFSLREEKVVKNISLYYVAHAFHHGDTIKVPAALLHLVLTRLKIYPHPSF